MFGALLFRLLSVFQITLLVLENLMHVKSEVYGGHFFHSEHKQKSKWFYMVSVA